MELDAAVAETQKSLGAVIQKPKLTENLLKKPPFRFLHDIVTEVKRVSGFPSSDILTDFDLDSGNFKDKDSKVAWLNKVIGAVSDAVGPVTVRPLKIVAGLEPENTNALLQALAKAASGGGGKPAAEEKKAPPPQEKPPPPSEAPKQERPKQRAAEEAAAPSAEEHAPAAEEQQQRKPRTRKAQEASEPEQSASTRPSKAKEAKEPEPAPASAASASQVSELLHSFIGVIKMQDDDLGASRRLERPRTALRAPPKVQTNVTAKDTRPDSKQQNRQAAKVIAEGETNDDDDDDGFLGAIGSVASVNTGSNQPSSKPSEGHGMLVRNMLQAEADIVGDPTAKSENVPLAEQETFRGIEQIERCHPSIVPKYKPSCKVDGLSARGMIGLKLETSTHTDACQDLDNMTKEMQFWMKDKEKQTILLDEEEKKSEVELEKLHTQLQVRPLPFPPALCTTNHGHRASKKPYKRRR
eukprot:766639-Hanusia_phi.AAC.5